MNYTIEGGTLPTLILNLEAGETIMTEGGAMSWMSPNMRMETTTNGGFGKMMGRMFSGEKLFMNRYTAQGGQGMIAMASSLPGSIKPFEIVPGRELICQKSAFLSCTPGVELSVAFQKRLGAGFFGGEGFIMQKLSGQGLAFIEIDGYCKEYELAPGQQIILDTGYLAAMEATCTMDIKSTGGVKNALFGGEGFFNTIVTGPGKVYVQSMPMSKMFGALGSTNK